MPKPRSFYLCPPKGKFGSHKYAPEDWVLDPAKIRRDLAPYMDYYGVARED